MAHLFPPLDLIKNQSVKPTQGELDLLIALNNYLDDTFEIYWQPYLNGDQPDIVILRQRHGVLIIEVKDWDLDHYSINSGKNWILNKNGTVLKSPLKQVDRYKFNFIQLHMKNLYEKVLTNSRHYTLIKTCLFFSKHTRNNLLSFLKEEYNDNELRFMHLLGHDSLQEQSFAKLLKDSYMNRPSDLFTNELYFEIRRYLQPPIHQIDDGIDINYTTAQRELSFSRKNTRQKIKGIAGSGKTLVLAKRAVNSHKRTCRKVLILTYNLSLKNYIRDKINEVREKFPWDNFNITNYHQFFISEANNQCLRISSLAEWQNVFFFERVKNKIYKYDTILIDEAQDFLTQWIEIITKYFLKDNGEFIVFGDEKQNVYNRVLDDAKEPIIKTISGRWNNTLNKSFRFTPDIAKMTVNFQNYYLKEKYNLDNVSIEDIELTLPGVYGKENIIEYYSQKNSDINEIYNIIYDIMKKYNLHPSDVGILDTKIEVLRELDHKIRRQKEEKTKTTFEKLEHFNQLKSKNNDLKKLQVQLEIIRRKRKNHFYMKTGTMKLSTIHSFKGWEIPSLFLIISKHGDKEKDTFTTNEMIYTGFTRARLNLFIINLGNNQYHEFFKEYLKINKLNNIK